MATPNMNLDLPTVSVTLGPEWAQKLNDAITLIDSHDHSSGKGLQITPLGINVDQDFDFQSERIINLFSSKFITQSSPLSGSTNALSISTSGGNLYYTNASGNAVQITSGGSLVTVPGSTQALDRTDITADLIIGSGDTFVIITVDTSAARQITLPAAGTVADGRIYVIKDRTGTSDANNITLTASGGNTIDGAGSQVLNSAYGSWMVAGDGNNSWYIL